MLFLQLSQDPDESLTDEVIAQQLQMDEDMELERQVHEDEEFAKTLAMLDQQPHAKKVKSTHTHYKLSLSLSERFNMSLYIFMCVCVCVCPGS